MSVIGWLGVFSGGPCLAQITPDSARHIASIATTPAPVMIARRADIPYLSEFRDTGTLLMPPTGSKREGHIAFFNILEEPYECYLAQPARNDGNFEMWRAARRRRESDSLIFFALE